MLGRVKAIVTERSTDVVECYVSPSGMVGSHVSKFYLPESLTIITQSLDSTSVAHEPTHQTDSVS